MLSVPAPDTDILDGGVLRAELAERGITVGLNDMVYRDGQLEFSTVDEDTREAKIVTETVAAHRGSSGVR